MERVKLINKGNRIWIGDSLLYLIGKDGDYRVYDDGEYEGKYCGSLKRLETMTEKEAVDYIWKGI